MDLCLCDKGILFTSAKGKTRNNAQLGFLYSGRKTNREKLFCFRIRWHWKTSTNRCFKKNSPEWWTELLWWSFVFPDLRCLIVCVLDFYIIRYLPPALHGSFQPTAGRCKTESSICSREQTYNDFQCVSDTKIRSPQNLSKVKKNSPRPINQLILNVFKILIMFCLMDVCGFTNVLCKNRSIFMKGTAWASHKRFWKNSWPHEWKQNSYKLFRLLFRRKCLYHMKILIKDTLNWPRLNDLWHKKSIISHQRPCISLKRSMKLFAYRPNPVLHLQHQRRKSIGDYGQNRYSGDEELHLANTVRCADKRIRSSDHCRSVEELWEFLWIDIALN